MESRCNTGMGMGMASTQSGRGVGLRGNGVQLLGYRGLLVVALLFVTATTFVVEDVHCSITSDSVAPAPTPSTQQTQPIVTFHQYEADALNAIFQMWTKQNPQLSSLLNWSVEQHPCDNLNDDAFEDSAYVDSTGNDFPGAWGGVGCSSVLQDLSEIPKHYRISVTSLMILGSNSSCGLNQCGFDGIIGHLPSEISNLTNLQYLWIENNPKLTGPVPVEIFQLPNLTSINLDYNSLNGTLPSDVYNVDCKLEFIELSHNNFSGNLRVSPQGTLFSSSLRNLNVEFNQLGGPINLQDWNSNGSILLLGGNPICDKIESTILSSTCRLNQIDESQPVISKSNTKMKVIIATSTSSALLLILLITAIYVWRLMGRINALHIILQEFDKREVKPNLYSYKEVKLATNNFDKDNKLGEGGFGIVYKGELFDGTQAAVKKLTMSSNQVLSEFLNEVIVISGLKHRNLVKLKGCCLGDGDQRILVFEYVENNNLAEALWMHGLETI